MKKKTNNNKRYIRFIIKLRPWTAKGSCPAQFSHILIMT